MIKPYEKSTVPPPVKPRQSTTKSEDSQKNQHTPGGMIISTTSVPAVHQIQPQTTQNQHGYQNYRQHQQITEAQQVMHQNTQFQQNANKNTVATIGNSNLSSLVLPGLLNQLLYGSLFTHDFSSKVRLWDQFPPILHQCGQIDPSF